MIEKTWNIFGNKLIGIKFYCVYKRMKSKINTQLLSSLRGYAIYKWTTNSIKILPSSAKSWVFYLFSSVVIHSKILSPEIIILREREEKEKERKRQRERWKRQRISEREEKEKEKEWERWALEGKRERERQRGRMYGKCRKKKKWDRRDFF